MAVGFNRVFIGLKLNTNVYTLCEAMQGRGAQLGGVSTNLNKA